MIRTMHGRGYRFVGPVEVLGAATGDSLSAQTAAAPAGAKGRSGQDADGAIAPAVDEPPQAKLLRSGIGRYRWKLAALGVVCFALLFWVWQQESPLPTRGPLQVAVLPTHNASGDPTLDWVGLGLMSAVNQILAEGGNLATLSAADVLEFSAAEPAMEARERLAMLAASHRVSHLVSSELRGGQGQLRVTYQILDREGRVRRRSITGTDVANLARGMGADLLARLQAHRATEDIADDLVGETYLRGRAVRLQGDLHAQIGF